MDIDSVYRLYFRDVFLFLQGLTHNEALAEELTQETFFKALDALRTTTTGRMYGRGCSRWPATPIIPTAAGQSTLPRWKMPKPPPPTLRTLPSCWSIRMRHSLYISACTHWTSLTKRCSASGYSASCPLSASADLRPQCRMGPGDLLPGQDPAAKDAFLFHLTFPITAEHPRPKGAGVFFLCAGA